MTKDEMQKEIDRLRTRLGIAITLIPDSKLALFFDRVKEVEKL